MLAKSLRDAIELAQNKYVHPREHLSALVRAESAALSEFDCGPRAKAVMNSIVRNE